MFALNVKTEQKNPKFRPFITDICSKYIIKAKSPSSYSIAEKWNFLGVFLVIHQPSVILSQEFCVFWPV